MWKSLILCAVIWGFMQIDDVKARPQDLQTGAAMVFAAVKGAVDNGAAAKDKKEIVIMGATYKNDWVVGFGDTMRDTHNSDSSSDDSDRRKRSASLEMAEDLSKFQDYENEFKNTIRAKRSDSDESTSFDSSSLSVSTSSSSSASSSESVEAERRKRSASFEILTSDILNMYKTNADTLKVKRSVVNESSNTSFELDNLKRHKRSGSFESLGNQTVLSDPIPYMNSTSSETNE